ncbi:MAG: ABC transporter ATP-binding protein [Halobacteriales archaeon]
MSAIEIDGVTKAFGDVTAVDDLSLTVEEGEIFGFLGPNGAGKSTTINMMLDFVRPTAGSIEVFGYDAQRRSVAVRSMTGVLPEGFSVYDRLTGRQHVAFAIDSKHADEDPEAILERVGLGDAVDRKAGNYSKGMRQRLALGMALVGDPDLLVLDEPTTGLDPGGARDIRRIVREEVDRGATAFFSSHILGQVEAVCDRVGILRDGEMVAVDSIDALRENVSDGAVLEVTTRGLDGVDLDPVRALSGVSRVDVEGNVVRVACDPDVKSTVVGTLEDAGARVEDFSTEEASLEDLFVAYTEDGGVEA